jgi:photosystem II stability/assembly factor-like uncharacterized protein
MRRYQAVFGSLLLAVTAASALGPWTLRNPVSSASWWKGMMPLGRNSLAATTAGLVLVGPEGNWRRLTGPFNELLPGLLTAYNAFNHRLCHDGSTGYVLVNDVDVYRSTNDGETWSKILSDSVPGGFSDFGCHRDTLTVLTNQGFYRANPESPRWSKVASTACKSANCRALERKGLLFVRAGDSLFVTADSGRTWNGFPGNSEIQTLTASDEDVFMILRGKISRFDAASQSWSRLDTAIGYVNRIAANGGYLYALVKKEVWRTRDLGRTWESNGAPLLHPNEEAWGLEVSDSVCLLTAREGVYRFHPFQADRALIATGVGGQVDHLVAQGEILVSYGLGGWVTRSGDRGAKWESTDLFAGEIVQMCANGKSFFASHRNGLHRSDDGGRTWKVNFPPPGGAFHYGVAVHGDTVVHGTSKRIYRSFDNGEHWAPDTAWAPSPSMYLLLFDGKNLIARDTARVYRSTDFGKSWTAGQAMPHLPYAFFQTHQFAILRGNIYMGERSDFFRSGDGGATWTRIVVPGRYGFGSLAASDSLLFGAKENDTQDPVQVSADSGTTWIPFTTGLYPGEADKLAFGGGILCLVSVQGAIYTADTFAPTVRLIPARPAINGRNGIPVGTDVLGRSGRALFPFIRW